MSNKTTLQQFKGWFAYDVNNDKTYIENKIGVALDEIIDFDQTDDKITHVYVSINRYYIFLHASGKFSTTAMNESTYSFDFAESVKCIEDNVGEDAVGETATFKAKLLEGQTGELLQVFEQTLPVMTPDEFKFWRGMIALKELSRMNGGKLSPATYGNLCQYYINGVEYNF